MRRSTPLPLAEFVPLLAFMVSIVAMSTDLMLPALGIIANDFGIANRNDAQLVVTSLMLGFAVGQLVAGPLSDALGRRPVICGGYAVFILGCLLALAATSFPVLLLGRVLQGLGAAAPRIVSMAMVRDGYEGREMARIMSFVMAVFIIVPAVAPALGQVITELAGWRATFAVLLALALGAVSWFAIRQPETLSPDARRPISARNLAAGITEVWRQRAATGHILAIGLIFGAFLGYLSSAQQIFQDAYGAGRLFPLYFGLAALAIGLSALFNARIVMQLGMQLLSRRALAGSVIVGAAFLLPVLLTGGLPPLWLFLAWLLATFFCMGLLFGNLNALAMAPLGHMAGLGAALVGAVPTLISLPIGWAVGAAFRGGVTPLVCAFVLAGIAALAAVRWAEAAPGRA